MVKTLRLFATTLLLAAVSGMSAQDEVIDLSQQNYTNGTQYASTEGINCTIAYGDGASDGKYYNAGSAIRIYGGGHFTVSSSTKKITHLTLTFAGTTYAPAAASVASVGTLTVGAAEQPWDSPTTDGVDAVTFTRPTNTGHWRLQKVAVTYYKSADEATTPIISGDNPFTGSTTVTIGYVDDAAYYTTDGTNPTTASTPYTAPFTLNASATVKAISVKGTNVSNIASQQFVKTSASGASESEPYTVADAVAVLKAGVAPKDSVYVKGIVRDSTEFNYSYGNITYNLVDNLADTDSLVVFRGKSFDGAKFTSPGELAIGATVIVKGVLIVYGTTYEVAQGSRLVSSTTGIKAVPNDAVLDANAPIYNLAGQKVGKDYKGIVIQRGKKYIKR